MTETYIEKLNVTIERLAQFSKSVADLALGQKKLLDQTKAGHQDYVDLLDDVRGALAVYGG